MLSEELFGSGVIKMAQIRKRTIKKKDLTIIYVIGKVSVNDITDALKDFYESSRTLKLLWDLSKSDLTDITSDHLREILSVAKDYAYLRKGGKTAFFISGSLGYGITRMYEIIAELYDHPVEFNVFRSRDEAMKWLES